MSMPRCVQSEGGQIVSARPERQGCPRTSVLRTSVRRGLDAGLAPTGEQLRQPRAFVSPALQRGTRHACAGMLLHGDIGHGTPRSVREQRSNRVVTACRGRSTGHNALRADPGQQRIRRLELRDDGHRAVEVSRPAVRDVDRARTGASLLVVSNADSTAFVVNVRAARLLRHRIAVRDEPTVTGSRGGNTALTDLHAKLASFGLITDGTTP